MWQSVAQAGGALAAVGEKIKSAQDLVQDADAQLKMDDAVNTYIRTAVTTGDKAERLKLLPAAELAIDGYATNPRLKVRADEVKMRLRGHAMHLELEKDIGEAKDKLNIILPRFLENGDEAGYKNAVAGAVVTGLIGREEGINRIQHFPTESRFVRARKDIYSQDPVRVDTAIKALAEMDTATLTGDQMKDRDAALDLAQRQRDAQGRQAEAEIDDLEAKVHGADLPPTDRAAQSAAIRQKILADPRLNGTQRAIRLREHDAWNDRDAQEDHRQTKAQEEAVGISVAEKILAVDRLPPEHQTAAYAALEHEVETNAAILGVPADTRLALRDVIRRHGKGETKAAATQAKTEISSIILDAYRTRPSAPILQAIMEEANRRIDASDALTETEKVAEHQRVMALPATVGAGRDHDAVGALRGEVIEYEKVGFGGPELKSRIIRAKLDGTFGVGKGAQDEAQGLLERVQRREFSDLRHATAEVRDGLHADLKDQTFGPEGLGLFDMLIDAWIKKNSDKTPLDALQYAKVQAAILKAQVGNEKYMQKAMRTWPAIVTPRTPATAPIAQAIPPAEAREVGKTYTFPDGYKATWRGTGWEAAQ
jgi:hypothetical protein